jgi:hypothetical protein
LAGGCLYPQLTAKARAAALDESRIRVPFAGPARAKKWLRQPRSLIVEDGHTVNGSGGLGAGGDTGCTPKNARLKREKQARRNVKTSWRAQLGSNQ